ncbi:hypothetical protein CR513_19636, partial [Mucuna pruriens]
MDSMEVVRDFLEYLTYYITYGEVHHRPSTQSRTRVNCTIHNASIELAKLKKQVEELLERRIIRPSISLWGVIVFELVHRGNLGRISQGHLVLVFSSVKGCKGVVPTMQAIPHQPKILRQSPNIHLLPTEGLHNRDLECGRDYALG